MDVSLDVDIVTATDTYIAGREAGTVLRALYHGVSSDANVALDALTDLLPIEQIATVGLVGRLNLSALSAAVILLATLRRLRTNDEWIHYNLVLHLNTLFEAGIPEAKLPAIIHSQLAIEGLKAGASSARWVPQSVLARTLATLAPRQAVRSAMVAAQQSEAREAHIPGPAMAHLGLTGPSNPTSITQLTQLAKDLDLGVDVLPHTTILARAAGLRSLMIEPSRRTIVPPVHGDASHYVFASEGVGCEINLPGIAVYAFEAGIFSIDATERGHVRHYIFDRDGECVAELAKGSEPFIEESVLECSEPVAILDDLFSSGMNICHFLLDHVTRVAIYERAWSRPGKFLLVDDYPYYRDIFARMGLADRIIFPTSKRISIRAPEILFCSNILEPGLRRPAHYCSKWALDFLRLRLGVDERPARPGRKLMISRVDAVGRRILNWREVLPVFRRHGFEIVELSRLSAAAQIELFRDPAEVAAVHGAGLTNLVFAPRDCSVLEILPPLVAGSEYWLLASALGQRYSALIAEDPILPRPDYSTWQRNWIHLSRDIVLPVERLDAALSS